MKRPGVIGLSMLVLAALCGAVRAQDSAQLYNEHCASCHGADRLGGLGPALIPESLARLRKPHAAAVIAKGRPATQMKGFGAELSAGAIDALVSLIYTPLAQTPKWGIAETEATRVVNGPAPPMTGPRYASDPLNLFVVVESGDHHVTILDGDRFEPVHRFQSRFALHGGPKFSPDGRFVYFGSRDGWITKFDLWDLKIKAEVRAGINTRNIALSKDGRHIAVANYLPHTLVMLSAEDLSVEKLIEVKDRKGVSSRVSAVYQAPPRNSFIAALKDVPEIWEISTDPNAPPVYGGFVHSHEAGMIEGLASSKGLFALRRIEVSQPLDDFFFDPPYRNLLGASRSGTQAVAVNLTVGREIAEIPLAGLPHLGSGISWSLNGRTVMATQHLKAGKVSVIDLKDWSIVKQIDLPSPGFFLRSQEGSNYVFADGMLGRTKDTIQVIDKTSLEIVKQLKPQPGKTAAHVEFDRYGRHALVSLWEMEGALIVYDTRTLEEVKRIPMSKPSGKYNVYNKITFSEGTSH